MYIRWTLGALVLLLSGSVSLHAAALDANLYATYDSQPPYTSIYFTVCGSLPQSEGCYGGGGLGPFGLIGSMIEGNPSQNLKNGTVTRYIYVLDVAYGSSGNDVALYVYKRVDTITASYDSISVSLSKTIGLPLAGGSGTVAYMAANKNFLFIGTSQNGMVSILKKSNLTISQYGDASLPLASITGDQYGFVTVEAGSGESAQFQVFDPNGNYGEDGGGAEFMLNTIQGTPPSTAP
jgi:hypothetical protein